MKRLTLLVVAIALTTATFSGCTDSSNSNSRVTNSNTSNANSNVARDAQPASTSADLGRVLANASASVDERVKAIDTYVSEVEAKLPGLTRREKVLKPEDLKSVTDGNWTKLHGYYDGSTLRRIKIYPSSASQKTEEFYLYNDKPVFVFIEPQGVNKQGDDRGAKGERVYFGNEGLIAWYGEDGKAKDSNSPDFKKMGDKLAGETAAFRKLVE